MNSSCFLSLQVCKIKNNIHFISHECRKPEYHYKKYEVHYFICQFWETLEGNMQIWKSVFWILTAMLFVWILYIRCHSTDIQCQCCHLMQPYKKWTWLWFWQLVESKVCEVYRDKFFPNTEEETYVICIVKIVYIIVVLWFLADQVAVCVCHPMDSCRPSKWQAYNLYLIKIIQIAQWSKSRL